MDERHVQLTTWEPPQPWVTAEDRGAATTRQRQWTSPIVESPFPATELIPSWNARTTGPTWLHVEGRVRGPGGWSSWLTFARWSETDPESGGQIARSTQSDQRVEQGRVLADVFVSAPGQDFTAWQLRLTLHEPARSAADAAQPPEPGAGGPGEVSLVAGCVSRFAIDATAPTSSPEHGGIEIDVPPLSQRRHVDTFAHWDRGGQSWCSPTSTTMVLRHWGVAPAPAESAWVGHDTDPEVVHAVRQVFDADYGGAGNWAFNTAYAATRGLRAYVTRLRDLTEAERFVAAGLPLVVSVSFSESELPEAGYPTDGHLLTVVGFTDSGDVVSNDPNSRRIPSNDEVRTVFPRDAFERVWLGDSGGLAYVMHPPEIPLPAVPDPAEPNWG